MSARGDRGFDLWNGLYERIAGDSVFLPISRTPAFAICMGGYAVVLQSALNAIVRITPVQKELSAGSEGIEPVGILTTFLLVSAWSHLVGRSARFYPIGLPWIRPRSLAFPVLYFGISFAFSDSFSIPFLGALALHGAYLVAVYEVYSHPLLPPAALNMNYREASTFLQIHLDSWWRTVQLGVSGSAAVIVGLATNYYLSVQRTASIRLLIYFIGPLVVGIGAIIAHYLWKLNAVEEHLHRRSLGEPRRSS